MPTLADIVRVLGRSLRGVRAMCGMMALLVMVLSSIAGAQSVSLPSEGLYRPGRYMPLRVETSAPGLVQIRGPQVQGIDWPAAGAGAVIVPLMVYSDSAGELELTVNGKAVRLPRRPMELSAEWPAGVPEIDPPQPGEPRLSAFNDAGYVPADRWNGGRSIDRRTMLVYAAVAATLGLGAMLLLPRRPIRLIAVVVASVVVSVAILITFPASADRLVVVVQREQSSDPPRFDWWTYLRSKTERRQSIPFVDRVRVLLRSPEQLARTMPVLICDPAGQPERIELTLPAGRPVALLRTDGIDPRKAHQQAALTPSTALARYAYGRRATADDTGLTIIPPARP